MTIETLIAQAAASETHGKLGPALVELSERLERVEAMLVEITDAVMTVEQVADMMSCDVQTIHRFIKEEGLEAVKRGKRWFCRRSRVLAFLTSVRGASLAARIRARKEAV